MYISILIYTYIYRYTYSFIHFYLSIYIHIYIYIHTSHNLYLAYSSSSSIFEGCIKVFRFWYISKCYRFLKNALSFSKHQLNLQN